MKKISSKKSCIISFMRNRKIFISPRRTKKIKTILTIIFLVTISLAGYLYLNRNKTPEAEAGWFDDNWTYRKQINITNVTTDLTNVQIPITLDTAALISAGKMQTNCADLRITDLNGNLLPYWVHKCNTASTVVYAWADNIISGSSSFFVYYGNSTASSKEIKTGTSNYPGVSCKTIKDHSDSIGDGTYYIDPNAGTKTDTFQASCDMTTDGGGWTINTAETGTGQQGLTSDTETAGDPLSSQAYNINKQKKVDLSNVSTESIIKRNGGTWLKADHAFFDSNLLVASQHTHWNVNLTSSNATTATGVMGYSNYNNSGGGEFGIVTTAFDHHSTNYYHLNASCVTHYFYQYGSSYNVNTALGDWTATTACASNGTQLGSWFAGMRGTQTPTVTNITAGTPATEEKGGGPVAYWSFDEGRDTTAYDASSNRVNGTLYSMSSTSDPNSGWQNEDKCISGKCLGFDGTNDDVEFGLNKIGPLIDGASSSTVSMWVKYSSLAGAANKYGNVIYASRQASANSNIWLNLRSDGGSEGKLLLGGRSKSTDSFQEVTSATALNPNIWYNVVGILNYASNTATIYINGAQSVSSSVSFGSTTYIHSAPGATYDAVGSNAGGIVFKGFIDEPKVYNYARTASQIAKDYNAGLSGMGKSNEGTSASIGGKSNSWLTNGLVGHWKMDEASWNGTSGEVKDASGNGYNGTASASGATTGAGKFGNGGVFDGVNGKVSVASITGNSGIQTVSAWVYAVGAVSGNQYIIDQGGNNNWIQIYGNHFRAGAGGLCDGTTTLTTNTWYHVTKIFDGNKLYVYLNGNLDCSTSATASTPGAITIGDYSAGGYKLNGKIDDLRIYNRALSPKEVSDLYNYAPGPVGYWNMDDATGTTAKDLSGNGNNGTLGDSSYRPNWSQGKYGGGLSFDGTDDYVNVGDPSSGILDMGNNDFTLETWFNTNNTSNLHQYFMAKGHLDGYCDQATNAGYGFRISYGYLNFKLNPGAVSCGSVSGTTLISSLPTGWHHGAVVVNRSGNALIYLDGKLDGSASMSANLGNSLNNSNNLRLGNYYAGNYLPMSGLLDEMKIYNYARTQKQISEDMNGGHPAGGSPVGSQVGYWKFDEGQGGTANNSGNGGSALNGTLNGPTWSNDGRFGKALSFDGSNDYASAPSSSSWNFGTQDFTITGWMKPSSIVASAPVDYWAGSYGWQFWISSNHLNFFAATYSSSTPLVAGTTVLAPNTWYHILFKRSGNTVSLYLDGKLEGTATYTNSFGDSSNTLIFGSQRGSGGFFPGLIDEVKIYNYALTDSEVQLDYNQGKSLVLGSKGTESNGVTPSNAASRAYCPPGNTEGNCGVGLSPAPVGEWKLDEGTSTTAKDTSGNGLDGTLTSGPTWTTAGKWNNAVKFDGVDDKITSFPSLISSVGSRTACLWFNTTRTTREGLMGTRSNTGSQGFVFTVNRGSSGNLTYFHTGGGTLEVAAGIQTNRWYYSCAVFNSTLNTASLYLNGSLIGSQGSFGTDTATIFNGVIGDEDYSFTTPFQGLIDDVKIFSYARTPAQIAWDYNKGAPVGWWKMDEGQGTVVHDESGNGNTGTMTNMDAGTDWVAGKNNGALDFDGGNDYVCTANNPFSSAQIGTNGTMSAWLKMDSTSTTNMALDEESYAGIGYGTIDTSVTTQLKCRIYDGSTKVVNIGAPELGRWYHVVMTWNGTTMSCYSNGNLVGSVSASGMNPDGYSRPLCLGTNAYAPGSGMFDGQIDDVRIYNYSLSAEQVKQIFNNGAVNFK